MSLLDTKKLLGYAQSYARVLLRRHEADPSAHADAIATAIAAATPGTPIASTLQVGPAPIPNAAFATIGGASPVINVGGMYDGATQTYTIVEPGLYEIGGSVAWDPRPAAANHLLLTVYLSVGGGAYNEVARFPAPGTSAAAGMGCSGVTYRDLNAGDKIQFMVYQDGGGSTNGRYFNTLVKFLRAT